MVCVVRVCVLCVWWLNVCAAGHTLCDVVWFVFLVCVLYLCAIRFFSVLVCLCVIHCAILSGLFVFVITVVFVVCVGLRLLFKLWLCLCVRSIVRACVNWHVKSYVWCVCVSVAVSFVLIVFVSLRVTECVMLCGLFFLMIMLGVIVCLCAALVWCLWIIA